MLVIYYLKYQRELNHIEQFCFSVKKWVKENCRYTFEDLQYHISCALASMINKTILAYYHHYYQKIDPYWENFSYRSSQ